MTKKSYTHYEVEGSPRRRWKRIVLWSSLVALLAILLVGTGSYLWFRAQVSSANDRVTPEVMQVLQEKPPTTLPAVGTPGATVREEPSPSAMNLLVIGSDRRSTGASGGGRSDTLMVVHIDPDEDYLSVLSLPRDLRVKIPGHGRGKLNTAFAYGGPVLAIKTIEETTGVDINHYMEIGFGAFTDVVDSLGGIYVDIDRRYYNPEHYYEPIDIFPGYQLLDGPDALDYVRFRHDRNGDFGRMERQQRFMTALREQAMGWDLPFKLPGLISALFSNITTDLDANEILRLARWGIGLSGDNIRGITLHGSTPTIAGSSYVVATEEQMAGAVTQLLHKSVTDGDAVVAGADEGAGPGGDPGEDSGGDPGEGSSGATTASSEVADVAGIPVDITGASGRAGETAATAEWLRSLGVVVGSSDDLGATEEESAIQYPSGMQAEAKRVAEATGVEQVVRTSTVDQVMLMVGEDFVLPEEFALPPTPDTIPDAEIWKRWAAEVPFAAMAPAQLPEGYSWVRRFPDDYATYPIKVGGGEKPAYRMLYASEDNPDQVLGITGTTWLDAPAASKGLEVTRDGVVFTVVRNDTKVERVWWKRDGVLYFVSNTLSHRLDQEEMLDIAGSMIAIPATDAGGGA